jgi:hypothetical protein
MRTLIVSLFCFSIACGQAPGQVTPTVATSSPVVSAAPDVEAEEDSLTDAADVLPDGDTASVPSGLPPLAKVCPAPLRTSAFVRHAFLPSQTDPQIGYWQSTEPCQFVYVPIEGRANGKLLVFLPGSGGSPKGYTRAMSVAAARGYRVIGLAYMNQKTIASWCEAPSSCPDAQDPATCAGKIHREDFYGEDTSACVSIDAKNSVRHRLVAALKYLDTALPNAGFAEFAQDGDPVWAKIAVGGHSQGAGLSAYIGTQREVSRVVMFSGPNDYAGDTPAKWIADVGATPTDRFYGLAHVFDTKHFDGIMMAWTSLSGTGIGPIRLIDGVSPPFENAHGLITALRVDGFSPHNMVAGNKTPLDPSGRPVYLPEWRYLFAD